MEGLTRQYCPAVGDSALGCITAVHADCYSINTGGSSLATLPHLSISSRTKHSPAKLKTGAVVHASVQRVNHLGEVALTCVEEKSCSRGLGVLNEGFITRCSSKLARNMLAYSLESALGILGRSVSFEITIGHNGRLWIATQPVNKLFLLSKPCPAVCVAIPSFTRDSRLPSELLCRLTVASGNSIEYTQTANCVTHTCAAEKQVEMS